MVQKSIQRSFSIHMLRCPLDEHAAVERCLTMAQLKADHHFLNFLAASLQSSHNTITMASTTAEQKALRLQEARQNAKETKRKQDLALAALPPRRLYVCLTLRGEVPALSDYHWRLYLHDSATSTPPGTKHHLTGGRGHWLAEHAADPQVFLNNMLVAIIEIGTISEEKHEQAMEIIHSLDDEPNDEEKWPGINCHKWLLIVVKKLAEQGLVQCEDVDALRQECLDLGNAVFEGAVLNEQPRPCLVAKTCK